MAAAAAPRTRAPTPTPDSAARHRPFGDPTARWAARSRVAPASAPPDGDDGAPGWRRLRSASGGVDHRPCSRPPWLSMTGIVRGGGEGGATPGGGGGCRPGAAVVRGGGGVAMQPPPRPCRSVAILAEAEGARELHRRNGLVVLANANKSAIPRVHGWPGECLFWLYPNLPHTLPPSPKLATLANREMTGKYYADACSYCGSAGNETQSRELNPGQHCYQRTLLPLSHYDVVMA